MKEDYCNFEIAKLLKEKGFDERCIMFYHNNELTSTVNLESVKENASCVFNSWLYEGDNAAPTLQMAMKWLREKYNIHIEIHYLHESEDYSYVIDYVSIGGIMCVNGFDSYENAVEAAILECLTNLI